MGNRWNGQEARPTAPHYCRRTAPGPRPDAERPLHQNAYNHFTNNTLRTCCRPPISIRAR